MNRWKILGQALQTHTSPQEIQEFYNNFLDSYRNAPNIHPDLVKRAAAEDTALSLRHLEPESARRLWLMSLPIEVSATYDKTLPSEITFNNPQTKTPIDRIMDDVHSVRRHVRKARTQIGFRILGVPFR